LTWEDYREIIQNSTVLHEDWYILGIDLGTTNSIISYWNNPHRSPEPIDVSNGFGKIPMPSVVQYRKMPGSSEGEWVIGDEAYRSSKLYPETTIKSIKRKMGTNETVNLDGVEYLPEEISAKILKELISHCKNINPKAEIIGLVVSVPYDFDDAAKKATMRACELAGLSDQLICLIEEPKAACLSYNFRHQLVQDEKIMVFDFGGGTLDITIFEVTEKDDNHIKLQVISEGGEAHHGGDNVDDAILAECFNFIERKNGQTKQDIAVENQVELSMCARDAKERLSGLRSYRIPFTFCIPPFVEQISREHLEELIKPFIAKTKKLVFQALREAYNGALSPNQIDRVLLEGGSSTMPWVKDMLLEIFSDESKIYISDKPAFDISLGATYYAAMKMGLLNEPDMESERMTVEFDVTVPHDIGIEVSNNGIKSFFVMIKRGTSYSLAKRNHIFTLSGSSPEDMTEFSLRILERINKDDSFDECKLIGELQVTGLPKRPSGKTRLKILFQVEEEGGLVKGSIEDLGFEDEFLPSGFKTNFDPSRFSKTILEG